MFIIRVCYFIVSMKRETYVPFLESIQYSVKYRASMLKIKNQHSLAWLDAYYIHIQEGCLGGLVVEAVARGKDSV